MAAPAGTTIDAIMVSDTDNVATCLRDIEAGASVAVMLGKNISTVTAADPVPRGHKLAVRPIAKGEAIVKYAEVIGKASRDIGTGNHVHIHNVVD